MGFVDVLVIILMIVNQILQVVELVDFLDHLLCMRIEKKIGELHLNFVEIIGYLLHILLNGLIEKKKDKKKRFVQKVVSRHSLNQVKLFLGNVNDFEFMILQHVMHIEEQKLLI
jgi:hypothetical protein